MFKNAKVIDSGVDPAQYHRQDAKRGDMDFVMSNSQLKELVTCPSRWIKGYKEIDEEKTKSLEWGSLTDVLLLDPDRYPEKYQVTPAMYPCKPTKKDDRTEKPWNGAANYCAEWEEEYIKDGIKCIKPEKKDEAEAACKRLRDDPKICKVLEESKKQVMIVGEWHDTATGLIVPVKALLDMLLPSGQIIDLKTCKSAHPLAWARQIYQYSYHMQAAFYKDLYDAATGNQREEPFHFIQSENFAPWEPGRKWLSVEFEQMGREKYQAALALYCQCLATKKWPGYDDGGDFDGWTMTKPEAYMVQ